MDYRLHYSLHSVQFLLHRYNYPCLYRVHEGYNENYTGPVRGRNLYVIERFHYHAEDSKHWPQLISDRDVVLIYESMI